MKLYMHTTHEKGGRPSGTRLEAEVVSTPAGYVVGKFGFKGEEGGWDLMPRPYITVGHLLISAEKKGIFLDTESCGIK